MVKSLDFPTQFCLSASLPLQHTLLVLLWLFSDEMYYIEALAYVQAACYPATPQEQRRRLCRCSTSPSQQASSESRGWRRQRSLLGQLRCVCRGPVHVCAAIMLMLVEICGHAPCQVLDHDIPVCKWGRQWRADAGHLQRRRHVRPPLRANGVCDARMRLQAPARLPSVRNPWLSRHEAAAAPILVLLPPSPTPSLLSPSHSGWPRNACHVIQRE